MNNKRSQAVGILMSSIHLDMKDIQNGKPYHPYHIDYNEIMQWGGIESSIVNVEKMENRSVGDFFLLQFFKRKKVIAHLGGIFGM